MFVDVSVFCHSFGALFPRESRILLLREPLACDEFAPSIEKTARDPTTCVFPVFWPFAMASLCTRLRRYGIPNKTLPLLIVLVAQMTKHTLNNIGSAGRTISHKCKGRLSGRNIENHRGLTPSSTNSNLFFTAKWLWRVATGSPPNGLSTQHKRCHLFGLQSRIPAYAQHACYGRPSRVNQANANLEPIKMRGVCYLCRGQNPPAQRACGVWTSIWQIAAFPLLEEGFSLPNPAPWVWPIANRAVLGIYAFRSHVVATSLPSAHHKTTPKCGNMCDCFFLATCGAPRWDLAQNVLPALGKHGLGGKQRPAPSTQHLAQSARHPTHTPSSTWHPAPIAPRTHPRAPSAQPLTATRK